MVIRTATLAFIAGFNHASFGYDEYNPYPMGTQDHVNWAEGYRCARSGDIHPALAFGAKSIFNKPPVLLRDKAT